MKMVIVIVKDEDSESITQKLTSNDFRITRIASTSGFLHRGVVTLLVGVNDERLDQGLQIIRSHFNITNSQESRATIFVVPIKSFERV